MTAVRLVLIETGGNQGYIFGSNRLQENIGASQLVHQAGTRWVLEAIDKALASSADYAGLYSDNTLIMANALIAPKAGQSLQNGVVEVIVAASGKAMLLVDADEAETIGLAVIRAVTGRALVEAPGLAVFGCVGEETFALNDPAARVHSAVGAVHRQLEELRGELPPPEARFRAAPPFRECASTGAPAAAMRALPGDPRLQGLSAAVIAKRDAAKDGAQRVQATTGLEDLAANPGRLEDLETAAGESTWLAIIHADGNGFGRIFQNFGQAYQKTNGPDAARGYLDAYRQFSLSLEMLGRKAFKDAARTIPPQPWGRAGRRDQDLRPLVPIVMGGDDLTVICEGRSALAFTTAYLKAFEAATQETQIDSFDSNIPALTGGGLGAAAGIAVVKPHHPFFHGYDLAEDLCKSAKIAKRMVGESVCALDFHMQFDGAADDLGAQRSEWAWSSPTEPDRPDLRLTARPYLVSDGAKIDRCVNERRTESPEDDDRQTALDLWSKRRRLQDLLAAAAALQSLPRGQQHALREAAFRALAAGDPGPIAQRLQLIQSRYEDLPDGVACFDLELRQDKRNSRWRRVQATWLLDAMELIDLGVVESAAPKRTDSEGAST